MAVKYETKHYRNRGKFMSYLIITVIAMAKDVYMYLFVSQKQIAGRPSNCYVTGDCNNPV
jgi:hypothetical protein